MKKSVFASLAGVGFLMAASTGVAAAAPNAGSPVAGSLTGSPAQVHGASVKATGNIKIVASGETATEGWVAYTGSGTVTVDDTRQTSERTQAVVRVSAGGGEWIYGTSVNSGGQKSCSSQYHHNVVDHGSTATMNGYTSRDDVPASQWSYAIVVRYTNDTCYTYWRKN